MWYGARYVEYRGPEMLKYVISKRRVWGLVLGHFGRREDDKGRED
jgi:hypothetical protein